MGFDFRLDSDFFDHPKTEALTEACGAVAPLCLLRLWAFVARYRPAGKLSEFTDEQLEQRAKWTGDRGAFVAALVSIGWLDGAPNQRRLHDWSTHQRWVVGRIERKRAAKSKAQKRWANEHAGSKVSASTLAHAPQKAPASLRKPQQAPADPAPASQTETDPAHPPPNGSIANTAELEKFAELHGWCLGANLTGKQRGTMHRIKPILAHEIGPALARVQKQGKGGSFAVGAFLQAVEFARRDESEARAGPSSEPTKAPSEPGYYRELKTGELHT